AFGHTLVRDNVPRIELDFEFVLRFADFDATANPGHGNRVTAGVQSDVAFDIGDAFMKPIDFRNPAREWFQMHPFDGEQLTGNRTDMFFVRAVDAIAPSAGLMIQVLSTGGGASGGEVVVDKIEPPIDG